MRKLEEQRTILGRTSFVVLVTGIAIGATSLIASAQDLDHPLGAIKESTANDPAGYQLMVFCICLLVTMVLCLFAGTMYYFLKAKKPVKK